ncbi:hypothetical protein [Plantibacter sp. YIM 135249]|uniref:hypothetical protein n=1 Tax=Plantibacter sp. YIM 135249 TaxID=3423918 RepID=UPI003D350B06
MPPDRAAQAADRAAQAAARAAHAAEAKRILEGLRDAQRTRRRGDVTPAEYEDEIAKAVRSRDLRQLADLDVRRSIFALADRGMSQREIAKLVELSQPEVHRRLKRRELTEAEPSPREIILRRATGILSTEAMMEALTHMALTSQPPKPEARFDGSATSTGTAKELASSFQEGLLSKDEYEALRKSITPTRPGRGERPSRQPRQARQERSGRGGPGRGGFGRGGVDGADGPGGPGSADGSADGPGGPDGPGDPARGDGTA